MSRVGDHAPPEVDGHGADGIPHLAYLGLVHVDHGPVLAALAVGTQVR